jgi:hypothetical protein
MFNEKVVEGIKIRILCLIFFLPFQNLAVNGIIKENTIEADRPLLTIQYGACA